MADLRIVDAPLLSTVKGTEKIPTGGEGNFSVSVNQVADFAKLKWFLATEDYVDNAVGNVQADLNIHKNNFSNPHQVTKTQVGLGNVDNTADLDKPVSNATQSAIITANSGKADKSYVDSQNQLKADKVDLIASKISSDSSQTQQEINDFGGAKWHNKAGGYDLGASVKLANGDIARSVVENNTANPNSNMTGWVLTGSIKSVSTISSLISLNNQKNGDIVNVLSYREATNFALAKPHSGGGDFIYKANTPVKNDGVIWFNDWMRLLPENKLTPEMAGAYGNYVDETNKGNDDTAAIQNVLKYFKEESSVVEFDPQKKYYIAGTVLVPNRTKVYGFGCYLYGNAKTNDCFHTGYYVDNVLTDLTLAPAEVRFLSQVVIDGFRLKDFKSNLNVKGLTQGCILNDLRGTYSGQHIKTREHFFCTFSNLYCDYMGIEHSGKLVGEKTPAYDFFGFNGMINTQNIQAEHCPLAYRFSYSQPFYAMKIDAERNETAIHLVGPQQQTTIENCYLEDNDVHIDVSDCSGTVVVKGNFFNIGGTAILGNNSNIDVYEYENYLFGASLVRSSGSGSFRVFSKMPDSVKGNTTTYPAANTPNGLVTNKSIGYAKNFGVQESFVSDYNEATGDPIVKSKSFNGGIVPHIYYGLESNSYPAGHIPFCSHVAGAKYSGNLFPVEIMTSIVFSEYAAGIFCFYMTVNGVSGFVRGRFIGSFVVVEQNQLTGITVTGRFESLSGVMKMFLLGFSNSDATTAYAIRGFIRLTA